MEGISSYRRIENLTEKNYHVLGIKSMFESTKENTRRLYTKPIDTNLEFKENIKNG